MKAASSANAHPINDPLIDEVRAARRNLSASFDDDLPRLCAHLRQIEERHEARLVKRPRQEGFLPGKG